MQNASEFRDVGRSRPQRHASVRIDQKVEPVSTAQFAIEERDIARQALEDFRATNVDFADCLIGRKNRRLGCDKTFTFDQDLRKLDTFEGIS